MNLQQYQDMRHDQLSPRNSLRNQPVKAIHNQKAKVAAERDAPVLGYKTDDLLESNF